MGPPLLLVRAVFCARIGSGVGGERFRSLQVRDARQFRATVGASERWGFSARLGALFYYLSLETETRAGKRKEGGGVVWEKEQAPKVDVAATKIDRPRSHERSGA